MTEGESTKNKLEQFIEQYKLFIGGFLLLLIILGGSFLIYQKNILSLSYKERLSKLEDRLSDLESDKVNTVSTETSDPKEQLQPQPSSQEVAVGQVSGTSITKENTEKNTGKININTATVTELDTLPGIGPTYAKRIIDYRVQAGGFKSIEEVKNVKGIGDKTYEKFKDKITVQ